MTVLEELEEMGAFVMTPDLVRKYYMDATTHMLCNVVLQLQHRLLKIEAQVEALQGDGR